MMKSCAGAARARSAGGRYEEFKHRLVAFRDALEEVEVQGEQMEDA